ncbi:hypothetical protein [Vibrio atypicus]|uniref:hypothetical protein n=1 Tax=Vibrio atypicus TaxID=558271 RepID=UPI00135AE4AC|nr:hypothetical protein [Vibrio atypicus]
MSNKSIVRVNIIKKTRHLLALSKNGKPIPPALFECYYTELDSLLFDWYCELLWERSIRENSIKNSELKKISILATTLNNIYKQAKPEEKKTLQELIKTYNHVVLEQEIIQQKRGLIRHKKRYSKFEEYLKSKYFFNQKNNTKNLNINNSNQVKYSILSIIKSNEWDIDDAWLSCNIQKMPGTLPSLTCLVGYKKPPNVLWHCNGSKGDILILCHEFGHVMHYNLAMENQNFYQFEPSLLVKEIIAFFWEALSLVYLMQCVESYKAKAFLSSYKKQSNWYIENAENIKQENQVVYGSYYPLARVTGEHLALALLDNRISQKQIIDYMKMGAKLKATTLIQAAGIKDNNDEPITPY